MRCLAIAGTPSSPTLAPHLPYLGIDSTLPVSRFAAVRKETHLRLTLASPVLHPKYSPCIPAYSDVSTVNQADWVKVKSMGGKLGYVPRNYVYRIPDNDGDDDDDDDDDDGDGKGLFV